MYACIGSRLRKERTEMIESKVHRAKSDFKKTTRGHMRSYLLTLPRTACSSCWLYYQCPRQPGRT